MIRKLKEKDLSIVMNIWLDANIKAHDFIPREYWIDNLELVKQMLPQSEVYVYENEGNHEIQGFVGINEDYIAGIFVCSSSQSNGIGKQLLDFVKTIRNQLTLSVYQRNERAIKFYQREGFKVQCENIDENTGEKEYLMVCKNFKITKA